MLLIVLDQEYLNSYDAILTDFKEFSKIFKDLHGLFTDLGILRTF
jgi:hypothetical protein